MKEFVRTILDYPVKGIKFRDITTLLQDSNHFKKVIETSLRAFMSKQVRKKDIGLFYDVTGEKAPNEIGDVPLHFLIPSFIISELKTAFQIGFLLYIPFLVLDMVIASVLMAMGMMMLPPIVVSMPFKLLLFVLVDGWQLVTGSILRSFS